MNRRLIELPNSVWPVIQDIEDTGAKVFVVGGSVRDAFLGVPSKDLDFEVFGISIDEMESIISKHAPVKAVGKKFGILNFTIGGEDFDFAVARKESKIGIGRREFNTTFDPNMTTLEAARRRDWTINSMMWRPTTGELIDHFGGQQDIKDKLLRPVALNTFVEDAGRILRGMQFAARMQLTIVEDESAKQAIASLVGELLNPVIVPTEVFVGEFRKLCVKGVKPSMGIRFLDDLGILHDVLPRIAALKGVKQNPLWHPEGDVFNHTMEVMDAMAAHIRAEGVDDDTANMWMLTALVHDIGKPLTTFVDTNGSIVAPFHAAVGADIASEFVGQLTNIKKIVQQVTLLTEIHMSHINMSSGVSKKAIRKLAVKLADVGLTMRDAFAIFIADTNGRPFKGVLEVPTHLEEMRNVAKELDVENSQPTPLATGKMLIGMGMKPGPMFGKILHAAFEAQINEAFEDEKGAQDWISKEFEIPS